MSSVVLGQKFFLANLGLNRKRKKIITGLQIHICLLSINIRQVLVDSCVPNLAGMKVEKEKKDFREQ